jgi:outer membrane protein assembly factor BamE
MRLQFVSPTVRRASLGCALATLALLTGCALRNPFASQPAAPAVASTSGVVQTVKQEKLFGILPIFRPDVQQGNFISREMVAQLKVGMTPDQVRFVLGTPLLMDVFHASRWDYPFRLRKGNGEITSSHVVVYFEDNRVARFEGGDLPDEKDYLLRIAAPAKK